MREQEYDWMARLEQDFWWYRGMREILRAVTNDIPRASLSQCLDAGCGTGFNLQWIPQWLPLDGCFGLDLSERALAWCRSRGLRDLARGDISRLPFRDDSLDLVLSLDSLQCLPESCPVEQPFGEFHRVLRPGGWLFLRTAAYDFLKSAHDEAVHANRRFTGGIIRNTAKRCGFETRRLTYANTILFPLAALRRLASRGTCGGAVSDVRPVPRWMDRLLYSCLAWEAWLLSSCKLNLPFGLSIVFIGRKFP